MSEADTLELVELKFKSGFLERFDLPDIAYPLTQEAFEAAISNPTEPVFAEMLFGLQLRSRDGSADWVSLEPAMDRLAQLMAPEDSRDTIIAASERWWLEIGPVDLDQRIITVQRENDLIAAISPREDGRLRIACYRPLDAKSAEYLIGLGVHPSLQDGSVCMRENNWEYALDCSAGSGNWYAFERGEAHLSYWDAGIGIMQDGSQDPQMWLKRNLAVRQPAKVAMEIGVVFSLQV